MSSPDRNVCTISGVGFSWARLICTCQTCGREQPVAVSSEIVLADYLINHTKKANPSAEEIAHFAAAKNTETASGKYKTVKSNALILAEKKIAKLEKELAAKKQAAQRTPLHIITAMHNKIESQENEISKARDENNKLMQDINNLKKMLALEKRKNEESRKSTPRAQAAAANNAAIPKMLMPDSATVDKNGDDLQICRVCGGDGANGGCINCDGSGWIFGASKLRNIEQISVAHAMSSIANHSNISSTNHAFRDHGKFGSMPDHD